MSLADLLVAERSRQRRALRAAALCAAVVAASSVLLLGLSGWFITASAVAGLLGSVAASAFNYMLPSAAIRLLAILRTVGRYGERLTGHQAALHALARIRRAIFIALAAGPRGGRTAIGTGEASARLVQDVNAVEDAFIRLSAPWGLGAAILAGCSLILFAGVAGALAALFSLGAMLFVSNAAAHRAADRGWAVQREGGEVKARAETLTHAAAELRCFGLEEWAESRICVAGQAFEQARRRQAGAEAIVDLVQAAGIGVAVALVVMLSARAGAPRAALAALAAAMMLDAAAPIVRALTQRARLAAATRRLDEVLDHPQPSVPGFTPSGWRLRVRDAGRTFVPGERILLDGASGAGKTSLIEALLALRPSPEALWIDGVPTSAIDPRVLRAGFAWLPQDATMVAGTVRENLGLARSAATDGEIWRALHDAALDDRIRNTPDGLETWLGENGARLSGGERRRLALARAYLSHAPWLLLDEPSEGLDEKTEALVAARMEQRLDRTGQGLILASHRPRIAALAQHRILVGQPLADVA